MISLDRILSGKPILLTNKVYFYQPTVQEVSDMGEGLYWSAINLWSLERKDMVTQETEQSKQFSDYEIWKMNMFGSEGMKKSLGTACQILLKSKIEFFDYSGTIYIGEEDSGVFLDEPFYNVMRDICKKIIDVCTSASDNKDVQYKETDNMSEREKEMLQKMRASEKLLEADDNPHPEDALGRRILALTAIGKYTLEQVYNMTMLQINLLLKKYLDIQTFELQTQLSPYISSEDKQDKMKSWLD